jgi:hypothetical protein
VAERSPGGNKQPNRTKFSDFPLRRALHSQDVVSSLMGETCQDQECEQLRPGVE